MLAFALRAIFSSLIKRLEMTQVLKKDLFAPDKPKRKNKTRLKTTLIPKRLGWSKENGSWAVKMGIVKTEQ